MRKIIYSIEGNIGSGKSTLLKSLIRSMPQITPIPEPVENWQHVAGYNLLDKYYEDPERWGYTFQVNCILSRMTELSKSLEHMKMDRVYVSERSVQADKFIFARLMHKLKKLNDMEYHLYLQMFNSLENLFNKHAFTGPAHTGEKSQALHYTNPSIFSSSSTSPSSNSSLPPITYRHIYLKTSPQKCFQRIKKRARHQQQKLEYNYIKQLDNLHDQWLIHGVKERHMEECLVLDGQREFQTDQKYLGELIGRIKSYIVEGSSEEQRGLMARGGQEGKGQSEREKRQEEVRCYSK